MSGEVAVTIIGTTTAPAELRFTPAGMAVCNFSLAVNPRRFDKQSNEWREQPTQWYRCAVWRDAAENAAETLAEKGVRLIVVGTLNPREYEKDGVKRMSLDVDVEEMGPSLRWASASINRAQRGAGNGGAAPRSSAPAAPADDPWATGPSASSGGFGGAQEEPPF